MKRKFPHLRWIIAFALFLAEVLTYIVRNVIALMAPTIQKNLGIDENEYANILNYFMIAYTIAYLLSGRVVDKLGVRLSFALFVGWWSMSKALIAPDALARPDQGFPLHVRPRRSRWLHRLTQGGLRMVPRQSITEFDVQTVADEELAADHTRDLMIACFSHPAYTSFLLWDFWESSHWEPTAASWNKDWSIKKRGEVLEEWLGKR